MVSLLPDDVAARLAAAPFTYPDVGATLREPPAGWPAFRRERVLARRDFEVAAERLLRWGVQEGAGLRVTASAVRVAPGVVVQVRIGVGPLGLTAPCRVVEVIEEPDRAGFVYGTLPGHPERGEELFVLDRLPDGALRLTVAAFSRHGSWLTRLGGPVAGLAQRRQTDRYLRALDGTPS
ncbi:DUF1990 family protein [Nocardioides sp.]|uniref:DUF1990 family protein n=1 Tax=Nocardioides sp. TaxID=35761 RepID=UPI00351590A8